MSRKLPERPNLEFLKKQAKELLSQSRREDAAAMERFRAFVTVAVPRSMNLAVAQYVLAREYGFKSWGELKRHVETVASEAEPAILLTNAIRAMDANAVKRVLQRFSALIQHLDEPMADYGEGMQAIFAAVQRSDRATIDVLLAAGADINARSHCWAGGIGVLDECSAELAPFLIERGARLDAHSAARLGMFKKLQEFVEADPNVINLKGGNGQTPLHFASTIEIASYLVDRGAEIDAIDTWRESTPAQHMLRVFQARHYHHDRQDIARFLVAKGCRTDILMAAALGDLPLVIKHLEADPDCIRTTVSEQYFPKQDQRSEGTIYFDIFGAGRTPHLVARDFGHQDVFEELMARSPEDVKLAQALELGDPALFRGLMTRRPNMVADLSDRDRRRLPDAAQSNNIEGVRLMLEAGWPVDATGDYGLTALQWASWHGNAEMVRLILGYNPQVELKDQDHHLTALGSALHGSENSWHRDSGDYPAVVEALLDAGATAPEVTEDLEASPEVRELLLRRE